MSSILDYLTGPDDPKALAQAVDSLRARQGGRRLRAALADHLACEACQTHLVDYAQARELGLPLSPDLRAVEQHLVHCETCRAAYQALQTLSHSAEAETVVGIAIPSPDLTFLRPSVDAGRDAGVWQQVEAARRQLRTTIQIMFNQSAAWFSTWPGSLTPQPVPLPVLRGGAEGSAVQRLVLPAVVDDLSFELTITPGAGLAQIAFGVFQSAMHQPVGQVPITLLNQQRQRLQRADTNAAGLVTFTDLPTGSYYLQIRRGENHWEMMVVVNLALE
ncbi:MAG: carboxypeptidase-like regulatory domain-containing protein [Caldilineaceae bacterium]